MVKDSRGIAGLIARWTAFALADAGLILLIWTLWTVLRINPIMPGPPLGNLPRSLEALPAKAAAAPVRFAVVSDIQDGVEIFRAALDDMARRRPDFAILNGDLAYRPREEGFRYFQRQLEGSPYAGPFFCVAGDHDLVDRRDSVLFRHHYGPDRFAFQCGDCRFLLLNDCVNGLSDDDYVWIRENAGGAATGPAVRHRFLFMHYPPLLAPKNVDLISASPAYERLYALAAELKVDRVYSGHLHAYRRLEIAGVPYVVCGGGGGILHSPEAFHHYLEVAVESGAIREETVRLPAIESRREEAERFAYVHVWAWIKSRWAAAGALVVLVLAAVAWQVRIGVKGLAAWRRARASNS